MNNKCKIYEDYLTSNMHESDLIIKLDSLQEKTIKDDGVIYTPWNIVQKMIEIAAPTVDMNIIEPSCGHGAFLIGLLHYMHERYLPNGEKLYFWFKNKVVGVEISQNTVNELKKILSSYFLKHFNLNVPPNDFTNIICHDGLTFDNGIHFNLCIGNPPYIRAKNLEYKYLQFLKNNYKSCEKGTIDIYFAFIEKYSTSVDSLVFITPNSFLTTKAGLVLKKMISNKFILLVDFKEKKIFKDANVYTCVFKTSIDNYTDDFLYGNDLDKTTLIKKTEVFGQLDEQNGLIDNVLSGIATLCDNIYIVKKEKNNKFYAIHNSISYEIEKNILAPYLKLTKIKSNKDILNINYLIYPYSSNKTIISEEELQEKYPLTYKYLLSAKKRLLRRDKGKTEKYESWYAYGRKQGLHNITEKNIVIIPQMIGKNCKPNKINIGNLLNNFGKIVFTSGFVIPLNKKNKIACEHILGDNFIEFAKKNGKIWPGKDENYYSLTVKQIKRFKV